MVDLLRRGRGGLGLSCGLCGTARTTTTSRICHGPVILRSRRRRVRWRHDAPRACGKSDAGKSSGSGTTTTGLVKQAGNPAVFRRKLHSCKLFRTVDDTYVGGGVHFACIDARLVSAAVQNLEQRARSDVAILTQGILRLDMRARQDVALIGSSFLKLDARAREDTEKLDVQAREKVKRLRRIAVGLQETARLEAEEHWNDGALEADLRLADLRARRRAMEDAYVSVQVLGLVELTLMSATAALVEVVRRIQNSLVNILKLKKSELRPDKRSGSIITKDGLERDTSYSTGSVALDRLLELEEAYSSMASLLLVEPDGIDCTDPDELELVVATLLDMDEVAGGSGATFLAECATSPDVATRRALADALADAPSLWALGNAGMGALQRLAKDSNPAVAAAAANAIEDFNQQWRMEDPSTFFYPQQLPSLDNSDSPDESEDI